MTCPNCGTERVRSGTFCPWCGEYVKDAAPPPRPAPTPRPAPGPVERQPSLDPGKPRKNGRIIALVAVAAVVIVGAVALFGGSGECREHAWLAATCTAPQTCMDCGVTSGTAADHCWVDATCTAPKTCELCGATDGAATGHWFEYNECTCGMDFAGFNSSVSGNFYGRLDSWGHDGIIFELMNSNGPAWMALGYTLTGTGDTYYLDLADAEIDINYMMVDGLLSTGGFDTIDQALDYKMNYPYDPAWGGQTVRNFVGSHPNVYFRMTDGVVEYLEILYKM